MWDRDSRVQAAGLSVVVPATDDPPTLERCRAAIKRGLGAADELIVITEARAPGPAAARNAGALRARRDVVVFVDADVVVRPDALSRIRKAFARRPGLTALFGSYDDSPEASDPISGFRNLLHHHVHQASAGPIGSFWAGLGAVRRTAFIAAGGFDEGAYPEPSIEDVELGLRLSRAGARIELDPGVQGTHLKRWTLGGMLWTDFSRRGAPWVELIARDRRRNGLAGATLDLSRLNLGLRHRASALLALGGVVMAAAGKPRAVLAAGGALVILNRDLYALLWRRRGPVAAAAAVPLHALHHLAAAASVPVGVIAALRAGSNRAGAAGASRRSPPGAKCPNLRVSLGGL